MLGTRMYFRGSSAAFFLTNGDHKEFESLKKKAQIFFQTCDLGKGMLLVASTSNVFIIFLPFKETDDKMDFFCKEAQLETW